MHTRIRPQITPKLGTQKFEMEERVNTDMEAGLEGKCVCELVENFRRYSVDVKQRVLERGRPCPTLKELFSQTKKCKRYFNPAMYSKYEWLCGCSHKVCLFCWPCALFSVDPRQIVLAFDGVSDLNNLNNILTRHCVTKQHIGHSIQWKTFGKARIDIAMDDSIRLRNRAYNLEVSKNRELMKRLISVVCLLSKQELAFRGHDESEGSHNRGNYIEMLKFLSEFDKPLSEHLESASIFKGFSSSIQNDLITSIRDVLSSEILNEIRQSPFASILVDEATDTSNSSQLSICLRVSVEGKGVFERIVKLVNVSERKNAEALSEHILEAIRDANVQVLVAQNYDGASVMSSGLNGVQKKVRDEHPLAHYIHCHAHRLNLVLSQGLQSIACLRVFFSTVHGLANFFSTSSKRTSLLDKHAIGRLPKSSGVRWGYNSRTVGTICDHREKFVSLFEDIMAHPEQYDGQTYILAEGFLRKLNDFEFVFLLMVTRDIFSNSDILFKILQERQLDLTTAVQRVDTFRLYVGAITTKFAKFYHSAVSSVGECRKRTAPSQSPEDKFKGILEQLQVNLLQQICDRFSSLKEFDFLELLHPTRYSEYSRLFPHTTFDKLLKKFGRYFDSVSLKNELIVLYSSSEFSDMSPLQLFNHIFDQHLTNCLPNVYTLSRLIITIPSTTATVERSFSTMKRIKSNDRSTINDKRLEDLIIISSEKQLLQELRQKSDFYDKVIDLFARKDRRIPLLFK